MLLWGLYFKQLFLRWFALNGDGMKQRNDASDEMLPF